MRKRQYDDERTSCLKAVLLYGGLGGILLFAGYQIGPAQATPSGDANPFGIFLMFVGGLLLLITLLVIFNFFTQ